MFVMRAALIITIQQNYGTRSRRVSMPLVSVLEAALACGQELVEGSVDVLHYGPVAMPVVLGHLHLPHYKSF